MKKFKKELTVNNFSDLIGATNNVNGEGAQAIHLLFKSLRSGHRQKALDIEENESRLDKIENEILALKKEVTNICEENFVVGEAKVFQYQKKYKAENNKNIPYHDAMNLIIKQNEEKSKSELSLIENKIKQLVIDKNVLFKATGDIKDSLVDYISNVVFKINNILKNK